jgi:hypothetical protein
VVQASGRLDAPATPSAVKIHYLVAASAYGKLKRFYLYLSTSRPSVQQPVATLGLFTYLHMYSLSYLFIT